MSDPISSAALAPDALAQVLRAAAQEAGDAILRHVAAEAPRHAKADGSFATDADLEAEQIIIRHLGAAFAEIPIIAEESASTPHEHELRRYFLIDPLDGTRGFAKGGAEYTVNIALIENGRPVAGVIHAPALRLMSWAVGGQTFLQHPEAEQPTRLPPTPASTPGTRTALVSTHTPNRERLQRHFGASFARTVKSSLKFVHLAEGKGQVYPRANSIMSWDIAAGHALVLGVGGEVFSASGEPMTYSARDLRVPPFVAWSRLSDSKVIT